MAVWMDTEDHLAQHGVTVEQAEERFSTQAASCWTPAASCWTPAASCWTPTRRQGPVVVGCARVGYSRRAAGVLCVITVTQGGITYGATAFRANITYQGIYREANDG